MNQTIGMERDQTMATLGGSLPIRWVKMNQCIPFYTMLELQPYTGHWVVCQVPWEQTLVTYLLCLGRVLP